MKSPQPEPASWSAISPYIDEALEQIEPRRREALICHYLQGIQQAEIAKRLGVSQASVSRWLEDGVQELRARLEKSGAPLFGASLGGLMAAHGLVSVPQALAMELGKMAIGGPAPLTVGAGAAGKAAGSLNLSA